MLQDPSTAVGGRVSYRVIVTNTGPLTLSSLTVADIGNGAPANFTFWGQSSAANLGAGQSVTSDIACGIAAAGYQTDTATVTAIAISNAGTVTATDKADYTGIIGGSICIDKQVSTDGCHWQDVGANVLNDPAVLVGGKVYFRALITDTGPTALNNVSISDYNGPSFTFGGHSSTSLSAGQTITSDTSSIIAVGGHNIDVATVTGTISGSSLTVSASDKADYTGNGTNGCGSNGWGWGGGNSGNNGWGGNGWGGSGWGGSGWGNGGWGGNGGGNWGTGGWGCNGTSAWGNCGGNTNLWTIYGQAQQIEFCYAPSDCVSLGGLQAGLACVSGHNGNGSAFVLVTNNSNAWASGATCYFQGSVSAGQDITANCTTATINGSAIGGGNACFGVDTYEHVFSSQSAYNAHAPESQECTYVTNGSQSIQCGDQIGSFSVCGYLGTQGGHLI